MTPTYLIQRGTLSGTYRTVAKRVSEKSAWRAYFETVIQAGEKKRLQEKRGREGLPRTIKRDREYWT